MTKMTRTQKALVSSLLSLLLCFSMFIGTTFAWFTDSVTSGTNILKAGTLDVSMEWFDGTKSIPAEDSVDWKDASTGAIFNYDKWEPGYTEVRHIKIANEGTLALKYKLSIVPDGIVSKLADVIDVYYIDPAKQIADRTALEDSYRLGTLREALDNLPTTGNGSLKEGETDTITIALKMQESAGNEYQELSIGSSFAIQLLATQLAYENDSFDHTYDEDAEMVVAQERASIVNNQGKLGEAVTIKAKLPLGEMTVTVPAGVQLSNAEADALTLTVQDAAPSLRSAIDPTTKCALAYSIYLDGISDNVNPYINPNTGSKNYNYTAITVSIPVGTNLLDLIAYHNMTDMSMSTPYKNNLNYDATTGLLTFDLHQFCAGEYHTVPYDTNFTFVYSIPSQTAIEANKVLQQLGNAGGTVTLPATSSGETVLFNHMQDSLTGKENVVLEGNGVNSTTVNSEGAKIEADSLTIRNMSINSIDGMGITGDNTTLENISYTSAMGNYGLTVTGSDSTVKNSTFTGSGNNILMFANNSDTATSVTTVDNCTFESLTQWGNNGGLRFQSYNGTLNVTNCTINTKGSALDLGPTNSTTRGILNIENTSINSSLVSVSTVKTATFDTVTFDYTWNGDSTMSLYMGARNSEFKGCEFKTDIAFRSSNWSGKNVDIVFTDCTFDGVAITAENIRDHFDFSALIARDPKTTVTVNGTAVTLS